MITQRMPVEISLSTRQAPSLEHSSMANLITCPNCGNQVDSQARQCQSCGVDLGFAAVLAENETFLSTRLPTGMPVAPEILLPRLGEWLVENQKLSPVDLERALDHQAYAAKNGRQILLGQALRELNLVTPDILDQAITVQILQLQQALRRSNRELEQRVQERTQELERAIAKLDELNQLKANFIANISHELRTPLTHIKGYLDVLGEGDLGSLNESQQDAIEVLKRAEIRLEKLIEDLIQFALISRGKLQLNLSQTDIELLVRLILKQAASKASNAQVELKSNSPGDLPLVWCDSEKISWVIAQLVDNAIKFSSKGGTVRVETERADDAVTITVQDTGIGIPADRIEEIFEPFHQLDGSTTRRYGGTGMGLSLSNRMLAAHGAQLKVHSEAGVGSQFKFSLPINDATLKNGQLNV